MSLVIGNELKDFLYQSDVAYKEASDAHSKLSGEIRNHSAVKTSSWFGKFVSIFNGDSGILAWIGRQICKIWDKFKNECESQKKFSLYQKKQIELNKLNETLNSVTDQAQKRWQPIIDLFGSIKALNEQVTFCGNDLPQTCFSGSDHSLKQFPKGYILRGHVKRDDGEGLKDIYFLAFRGEAVAQRTERNAGASNLQQYLYLDGDIWKLHRCSRLQKTQISGERATNKIVEVAISKDIIIMNEHGKTGHFETLKAICRLIHKIKKNVTSFQAKKNESSNKYAAANKTSGPEFSTIPLEDALIFEYWTKFLPLYKKFEGLNQEQRTEIEENFDCSVPENHPY